MPPTQVRRVVTGHDAEGRSVIDIDGLAPAERFALVWTTVESPANNQDEADGGKRDVGLAIANGSVFRVGTIEAGARSPMHRTRSIDYGLVLEGELDMELDGGEVTRLKAGDVVVQRGTNHAWVNNGTQPCKMAWILIDAQPVVVGGKVLEPNR